MGLVNPLEVTPSVMHAICRYFAYCGQEHTVARSELESLLQPPPQPDGQPPGSSNPISATIDAAIELAVLAATDREPTVLSCRLPLPELPLLDSAFDGELIGRLRRQVLAPENTNELFASDRDAQDTTRSREFVRIAAWVLLQDPTGPGLGWAAPQVVENVESRERDQCVDALRPVVNDARWNSFRRWARYLGLVRVGPDNRVLPDPTTAVGDELNAIYADGSDLPIEDFLRRLGQRIPIVDGGESQAQVIANALKRNLFLDLPGDHPVSPALSFALKRLARRGAIRLDNRADAPTFRNLGNAVFTHIVRLGV